MAERRVALVTGGARRLGREIAVHLAANGWDVGVHYLNSAGDALRTKADVSLLGARVETFRADLSDEADCLRLVPTVIEAFGKLDAVINNASLFEHDDVFSMTHASLEKHWRSNTFPAIALARALHGHVKRRGVPGCAVNLLDQKLWNPNPDYLSYTLSKAALESATGLLARSLAPEMRVVGVAPGVTLASGPMSNADFLNASKMTPTGRSSTPSDIAQAVRYLLDARAVTGTTLIVDGGQHLSAQARDVMFMVDPSHDKTRQGSVESHKTP